MVLSEPCEVCVHQHAQLVDLDFIHRHRKPYQLIFYGIVTQQRHHNKGVCIYIYKIETNHRNRLGSGNRQCRQIGDLRSKLTDIRHQIVQNHQTLLQLIVQPFRFLCGKSLPFHQLVDIQPVALHRRHAACGCVGLVQITHSRKLCQFISNGRRGAPQSRFLRQQLAAHRFCGFDVLLYNSGKYFLFSLTDLHAAPSVSIYNSINRFGCLYTEDLALMHFEVLALLSSEC